MSYKKEFKTIFGFDPSDLQPPIPAQRAWDMVNKAKKNGQSFSFPEPELFTYSVVENGNRADPYVIVQRTATDGEIQYAYIFDTNDQKKSLEKAKQLHNFEWWLELD
jgi:hypothetical protein